MDNTYTNRKVYKKPRFTLFKAILILFFLLIIVLGVITGNVFLGPKTNNTNVHLYKPEITYVSDKIPHIYNDFVYKLKFTNIDDKESASSVELISYEGEEEEIEIPDKIDGLPVTDINNSCFAQTEIKAVLIPSSITRIDNFAFYKCLNLETVSFSEEKKNASLDIGDSAFSGCSKLKELSFPYTTLNIGNTAFQGCFKLSKVEFNEKCTLTIGMCAFQKCNFKSILLPQNTKKIDNYAFDNCKKLKKVNVPKDCEVGKNITRITNDTVPKYVPQPTTKPSKKDNNKTSTTKPPTQTTTTTTTITQETSTTITTTENSKKVSKIRQWFVQRKNK